MNNSPKPSPCKTACVSGVSPRVIAALFIAVAFGVSLLLYDRAFSAYDDGIAAEGARLVLKGKVPYRDFWALYAPGSYYVNALLLAIVGKSFLAIRLALPILITIQAGFLFGILRRVVSARWAVLTAAIVYIEFIPVGITTTNPITYWLTAAMAGFYCFVRWTQDPHPAWIYACGLLLGVSALFRQDGGIYAIIALSATAFLAAPRLGMPRFAPTLRILGAFAVVVAAAVAFMGAQGALGPMFQYTINFALTKFPRSRSMPYPLPTNELRIMGSHFAPQWIAFIYQLFTYWVLPAALVGFGLLSVQRLWRGEPDRREVAVYGLAIAAMVLFAMISVRPVSLRICGSITLSAIVFAALCSDRARLVRIAALVMLACSLIAYGLYGVVWVQGQRAYGVEYLRVKGGIRAGRGYADMIAFTSSYVYLHTKPGEKIMSGDPAIYFTTTRDSATQYFEPHPLLTDTPEIQRKIIRDMEREHVRCFVRSQEWVIGGWFTIEPENQPKQLIQYVKRNFGILQVYRRVTPFRQPHSKETL